MKKLLAFLLMTAMILSLAACAGDEVEPEGHNRREREERPETPESNEPPTDDEPVLPPDEPDEEDIPEEAFTLPENLLLLEMIGYYFNEEGSIILGNWETECPFDLYREYFFGTWDGDESWGRAWIIDDSEKNNMGGWFVGTYRVGDVLLEVSHVQVEGGISWIDMNQPDIMYATGGGHLGDGEYIMHVNGIERYRISVLTRTDAPVNEPENGFLSYLRQLEMAEKYGIDIAMLSDIEDFADYQLWRDSYYCYKPIYLISEEPEKLVLKTTLSQWHFGDAEVDVVYTLERIDGEWVRTLEVDEEQFEAVKAALTEMQ